MARVAPSARRGGRRHLALPHLRPSAADLAFEFQRLLDERLAGNRAGITERHGISRARVTRVLNLLRLPREALDLLADSGDAVWSERRLRDILALSSQEDQIVALGAMAPDPYRQTLSQGEPARSALGSPGYRGETATQ